MTQLLRVGPQLLRLWYEDDRWLEATYPVRSTLIRTVVAQNDTGMANSRVAVELLVPYSGMTHYGLLGATFEAMEGSQLVIRVDTSAPASYLVAGTLASRIDEIRAGLLDEYASAVIDGAITSPTRDRLGAGYLHFGYAAHSSAGSAPIVFSRLARLVVAALTTPEAHLTPERAAPLLN